MWEREWRNGVLVLISTRLGLKKVSTEYMGPVQSFFMQQLNCGIIGGRPKEAYYLVGMQEDSLIFLDPHNTLPTVPYDLNEVKKNHMSFHEQTAKKIHYQKIDPTMTFAFYLRDYSDFEKFKRFMENKRDFYKDNWIFSQYETKPAYLKEMYQPAERRQPEEFKGSPELLGFGEGDEEEHKVASAAQQQSDDSFEVI